MTFTTSIGHFAGKAKGPREGFPRAPHRKVQTVFERSYELRITTCFTFRNSVGSMMCSSMCPSTSCSE
jgi:hypothetical protein